MTRSYSSAGGNNNNNSNNRGSKRSKLPLPTSSGNNTTAPVVSVVNGNNRANSFSHHAVNNGSSQVHVTNTKNKKPIPSSAKPGVPEQVRKGGSTLTRTPTTGSGGSNGGLAATSDTSLEQISPWLVTSESITSKKEKEKSKIPQLKTVITTEL